ncbi:MAG: hypothetical protein LBU64_11805 [Planctomycetota bacterium]|jgi:type II secretory pathway component GspD/PulD (secretin)|nr:hypothetical protein [Planctomycetota bacterium]
MKMRAMTGLWLAASLLPAAPPGEAVRAGEAMEILSERDGGRANSLNINYRQVRLEKVLDDLSRARAGVNLQVRAESFQEEQELLAAPVTLGPLTGVSWDTAVKYVADRLKLIVNRAQFSEGVVYLEKVARFTDTFDGVRLGEAVREIARRGNANVIFSPQVGTDVPVYLSFTDVPWREALGSLLKAHGCTILNDADGRIMRISTAAEADVQFETRSRPLRYLQPDGSHFRPDLITGNYHQFASRFSDTEATVLEKNLKGLLEALKSPRGVITYESRTNTLILRDTPINIQQMLQVIDELDQPPSQVLIETRLISMEENPSLKLGVKWGQDGDPYEGINNIGPDSGPTWNTSWPWANSENFGNLGPVLGATGTPAMGGITTGRMSLASLKFALQAAQYDDSIKITQAPQILVLDNEEATVFIGNVRTYALIERTVSDRSDSFSVNEREILEGVQLMVIPHVARGTDSVILEIIPKETDTATLTEVQTGGGSVTVPTNMPVKVMHTKMMLQSTETGVIAGLFKNQTREEERKIPGLSKLPVIGRIFKHNSTTTTRNNTAILVTPTIIPPRHGEEFDQDIENFKNSLASSLR